MDFVDVLPDIEEPVLDRWEIPEGDSPHSVIEAAVDRLESTLAFGKRDRFAARLCLDEALTNACEHGGGDGTAPVILELYAQPPVWVLRVRDQGPGYDPESLVDPLADPFQERGRGLPILDSYAEQVLIADRGRDVMVRIRVSGDAE